MSNPVRLRQSQTPRASAGAFPVSRPSLRCHPKRGDRDAKKTRPARTGARNRLQAQITLRPVADLIPYVNNPRTHSDEQVAVIAGSIREFGWTNPVLIDGRNGIIAGHGRVLAARKLGLAQVPCIELAHLTDAQRRAYVIADNQTALRAGWSDELLRLELGQLQAANFNLDLVGFDPDALASLFAPVGAQGRTDPDALPMPPKNPVATRGGLWALGRHRLLCGDATSQADVERLLAGAKPHLMVTDPPYGVEYDPMWRHLHDLNLGRKIGGNFSGRATGKVNNDDRCDWREAWALFPGVVAYVWHGGLHGAVAQAALESAQFEVRAQIVWVKQHFVLGRGDFHWQHEPCFYAVRKGKAGRWTGDRKQTTVWAINNNNPFGTGGTAEEKTGHSTQKPVECMKRAIENNSKPGESVYDPFVGSGTTIIAAEMTGRACHAIEIDPVYVDVAIERWQNFTGQRAAILDGKRRRPR
jgi:DNA modification methylase